MNIKPITIKPIKPAGAAPAAAPAEAAAPAPAPAAPAPANPPVAGIRPISIAPAKPAGAPAADSAPHPIVIQPSAGAGKPLAESPSSTTIRLKPVAPAPSVPAPKVAAAPAPAKPTVIAAPPARPAPGPSTVTAQAIKGKTSRISLDDALASPPTAASAPAMGKLTSNLSAAAIAAAKGQTAKVSLTVLDTDAGTRHQTLRMKAPGAAPAATLRPAAPLKPAPAEPAVAAAPEPADDSEAPTIRRKTLVLKKEDGGEDAKPTLRIKAGGGGAPASASKPTLKLRPTVGGAPKPGADAPAPAADGAAAPAAEAAAPAAEASGIGTAFNPAAVAPRKEKVNVMFPILAVASLIVVIGLCLLFMSQACGPDRSRYINFSSYPNWPEFGCPGASRVALD